MRTVSPEKFDFSYLDSLEEEPSGRGRKKKKKYVHAVAAFDIETSNLKEYKQAVMYCWQFHIDKRRTVFGRTWEQFRTFFEELQKHLKYTLVVWVHNLSFEFQFLKSVIPVDDAFALDERKILYFTSGNVEFRCSYLHSNMALAKFLEKMEVPTQKEKLDYSLIRYPWTPLTAEEISYAVADVKGLVEAITKEMKLDQDSLHTIPRTSTGYVRRKARLSLEAYQRYMKPLLPDLETIEMLQRAFRGGNTHGSRYWTGRIIGKKDGRIHVRSKDIASSYPAAILTERFPGRFTDGDPAEVDTYLRRGDAVLMDIRLWNVKLRDPLWSCPYIAIAKCTRVRNYEPDNGRILSADYIECTVTEIDFTIMQSEYEFEYDVEKVKHAPKRKLPIGFRRLVKNMYEQKTELKGVDAYQYGKFKNMVNALYGMTVQNPIKPVYKYVKETGQLDLDPDSDTVTLSKRYLAHGWLPYQIGVWVTAYARLRLEKGLRCIPPEDFLYADTDSIKYKGEHEEAFEKLNRKLYDAEYVAVDRKGKKHPIGIFEDDGDYLRFCHLGAKKYAYEDAKDGELHITIAGVKKTKCDRDRKTDPKWRKEGPDELGTLENFHKGFVFRNSGGQAAYYNEREDIPKNLTIDGHTVEVTTNIYLEDSTYTLSLAPDYERLLDWIASHNIRRDLFHDYE